MFHLSFPDCGLPPALANGMMKLMNNKTHFQSQADVICKHGFFLNGSFSTFNCTDDGHWSLDDSHRCLPVGEQHNIYLINIIRHYDIPVLFEVCVET